MQKESSAPSFYVVSMGKFSLLYFATLGLYGSLWFYLHWIKQLNTQTNANPPNPLSSQLTTQLAAIARTFLTIFFVQNLFARLRNKEITLDMHYPWCPQSLGIAFILLQVASVAVYMVTPENPPAIWQIPAFIVLLIEYYLIYKVQLVANRVEGDPFGRTNATITPLNAGFIAFGAMLWLSLLKRLFSGE